MTPEGILETALYADDLDAAESFYGGILGLPLHSKIAGRHVFFRCGNQMLLIFSAEATRVPPPPGALPVPPHGAAGPGHVCFRASASEIDAWRAHLERAGVTIESDFLWPSQGRSIYFRDPAGNSLEFAESKIWRLT